MTRNQELKTGWVEAICGPMFSGKSEELIRRLRRATIAGVHVQVFKPSLDARYSHTDIVTHNDDRMPAEVTSSADAIAALVQPRTEVVAIDEANFFGCAILRLVEELASSGRRVIVAGLDTDFQGRPFPPMPQLLTTAEYISKTLAICRKCGAPASRSQRLIDSDELIVVGAGDVYEARCRHCFEPGVPRQERLDFSIPGPF